MHLIHIEVFLSFAQTLVIISVNWGPNKHFLTALNAVEDGSQRLVAAFHGGVDGLGDRVLEPQKWPPLVTAELPNLVWKSQTESMVDILDTKDSYYFFPFVGGETSSETVC